MRVSFLEKVGSTVMQEQPKPAIGPDDVLIQVAYAGVCGSDLHSFRGTHPFRHAPVVLGHELSGTVAEMGEDVSGFSLGDAVTVMPYVPCGECVTCRRGQSNVCANKRVPGIKGWVGSFAEYFVAPANITYKLDPRTSLELGALAEPFAVGVHSVRRGRVTADSRVLVLGGGTIGLVTVAAAKKSGAQFIAVTDLYDYNLDVARALGADQTYNALMEGLVDEIRKDAPEGFDVIFLTGGAAVTVGQSVQLAARGARIVATALFEREIPVSLRDITLYELELVGTQIYTDADFRQTLRWLGEGDLPYAQIIDHVLPLEQAQTALEMMDRRTQDVIKVLLTP